MPTDLTGTPTSLGIGTYNVDADAPSGLGFNEAMDQIDALLQTTLKTPTGIATGEVPVWNGSAWVRSSVTGMTPSGLSGYPNSAGKFLRGDGSWGTFLAGVSGQVLARAQKNSTVTNSGGTFATGTDIFSSPISFTADGTSSYLFRIMAPAISHTQVSSVVIDLNLDGSAGNHMLFANITAAGDFLPCTAIAVISTPSAGAHTVNGRLYSGAGTQASIQSWNPIVGTLEIL